MVLSCDLALPLVTFLPKSPEDCWVVVMSKTKKWDVFLEKEKRNVKEKKRIPGFKLKTKGLCRESNFFGPNTLQGINISHLGKFGKSSTQTCLGVGICDRFQEGTIFVPKTTSGILPSDFQGLKATMVGIETSPRHSLE